MTVAKNEQCYFKTCRFRAVREAPLHGMMVPMCGNHAKQYETSWEKEHPS